MKQVYPPINAENREFTIFFMDGPPHMKREFCCDVTGLIRFGYTAKQALKGTVVQDFFDSCFFFMDLNGAQI